MIILYRDELREYDFGEGHPFRGDRFESFIRFLRRMAPEGLYEILEAEFADDEDLKVICEEEYIEFNKEFFEKHTNGRFLRYHSMDNFPGRGAGRIERAARLIVAQAKLACEMIAAEDVDKVVSIGGGLHHAKRNYGEGFCIYNDVAFSAKYLMEKYGFERIMILDTDAHAGNGTMEYFYDDSRVLFVDIHQDPRTIYPGTGFVHQIGVRHGEGFTVNIPLPVHSGDESYRIVFDEVVEPLVEEFQPEIILRNGGSDPHFADELTNLQMTVKGFRMIGEKVRRISEICDGREIDFIASGYNRVVLPNCWFSLISGLAGWKTRVEEPVNLRVRQEPLEEVEKMVEEVKSTLKEYWKCFS